RTGDIRARACHAEHPVCHGSPSSLPTGPSRSRLPRAPLAALLYGILCCLSRPRGTALRLAPEHSAGGGAALDDWHRAQPTMTCVWSAQPDGILGLRDHAHPCRPHLCCLPPAVSTLLMHELLPRGLLWWAYDPPLMGACPAAISASSLPRAACTQD